jgi:hypothetical protein
MSFLKNLFSSIFGSADREIKDPNGIYFYIRCNKCGTPVRTRADKAHDFERDYDTGELTWNKEVMDGGCFSLMYATVRMNGAFQVIEQSIEGGEFITWEEYKQLTQPKTTPADDNET